MIVDEHDLLFQTGLLLLFCDGSKCFTHDGDKHVHEHNRDDKSGEVEHAGCGILVVTRSIDSAIKVSQGTKHVNRDQHIQFWDVRVTVIVDWPVTKLLVLADNIVIVCKSVDNDKHHQHEVETVREGLLNELDVVGKRREKTHPVEHLDPHEEGGEAADGVDELKRHDLFLHHEVQSEASKES